MSDDYFHEVWQADVPAKDSMCMGSFQSSAEAERCIEVLTEVHPRRRFNIMRRPKAAAKIIDFPLTEADLNFAGSRL